MSATSEVSSFLFFRVDISGLQIIKYCPTSTGCRWPTKQVCIRHPCTQDLSSSPSGLYIYFCFPSQTLVESSSVSKKSENLLFDRENDHLQKFSGFSSTAFFFQPCISSLRIVLYPYVNLTTNLNEDVIIACSNSNI